MCATSDLGDVFADAACCGRETAEDAARSLSGKVDGAPLVVTGLHRPCPKALRVLEVREHAAVDPKKPAGVLAMMDSMHSRPKSFLARFKGVATKHLRHYLDRFCYIEQCKRSGEDRRRLLCKHACRGNHSTVRSGYIGMPDPFFAC